MNEKRCYLWHIYQQRDEVKRKRKIIGSTKRSEKLCSLASQQKTSALNFTQNIMHNSKQQNCLVTVSSPDHCLLEPTTPPASLKLAPLRFLNMHKWKVKWKNFQNFPVITHKTDSHVMRCSPGVTGGLDMLRVSIASRYLVLAYPTLCCCFLFWLNFIDRTPVFTENTIFYGIMFLREGFG